MKKVAIAATPKFSLVNRATWPDVLTVEHVAAIYNRAIGGIKKDCQRATFTPAPFRKQPYHWRKSDVVRDLDGLRRTA